MTVPNAAPDLRKVTRVTAELLGGDSGSELADYLNEAREYLLFYDWCSDILEEHVGIFVSGIVGVFLFRILANRSEVGEWLWVIVGDLPPTYLTCEECPNPASALDGYVGAMSEWVEAASQGESVAELIPVDVPATPDNAEMLRRRLEFLDQRILSSYQDDLRAQDGLPN